MEYDALLASRSYSDRSTSPESSANFFSSFANMFQGATAASGGAHAESEGHPEEPFERPDAEATFANIFDEVGPLPLFDCTALTLISCFDQRSRERSLGGHTLVQPRTSPFSDQLADMFSSPQ